MLGFFVPLYSYDPQPETQESKLKNVGTAFALLKDVGIRFKDKPTDVAAGDVKATLRILYCLFVLYNKKEAEDKEE